jgi:hypothetical protein
VQEPSYHKTLFYAIKSLGVVEALSLLAVEYCSGNSHAVELWMLYLIAPLIGAQWIDGLSDTSEVKRDRYYRILKSVPSEAWINLVETLGRQLLLQILLCVKRAGKKVPVTIVVDTSGTPKRGKLVRFIKRCWLGAIGKAGPGIELLVIHVVIGRDRFGFPIMFLIVPKARRKKKNKLTPNKILIKHLKSLDRWLRGHGLSLKGCFLSVDRGFHSGELFDAARMLGMILVTKGKSSYKVWINGRRRSLPGLLRYYKNRISCQLIHGVAYRRIYARHETFGEITVLLCYTDNAAWTVLCSSTEPRITAVRIFNAIEVRWDVENLFQLLKQVFALQHYRFRDEDAIHAHHALRMLGALAFLLARWRAGGPRVQRRSIVEQLGNTYEIWLPDARETWIEAQRELTTDIFEKRRSRGPP